MINLKFAYQNNICLETNKFIMGCQTVKIRAKSSVSVLSVSRVFEEIQEML